MITSTADGRPTRRLTRRSLAAGGTAAIVAGLGIGGLALSPAVAASGVAIAPGVVAGAQAPADDGILDWGMKESFRQYVEGPIADGEITMHPPATRNADGTFRFPDGTGSVDAAAGTANVTLGGGVQFDGHDGSLHLVFTDLVIEVADDAGTIVADVESLGGQTADVPLVTFSMAGQSLEPDGDGIVTLTSVATTLTTDGAEAFGGFYEPGTPMDPFSFRVHVEQDDPTTPPTTTPPTSPPPTTSPPTTNPPTTSQSTSTSSETAPTPTDPDPTATWEEGQVSSGLMEWGIKESFRSYIAGPIAQGGWTTSGVSEQGGIFRWTASFGEYDMDSAAGSVGFTGGVRFTGHEGSLDISISRPRVQFSGGDAVLVVDVRSQSLDGEGVVEQTSVRFATLDLAGATAKSIGDDKVSYAGIPATLTAAGAEGFGGFYEEGTELDPVTVAFAVGGATVPGGGSAGGPGLAGTGAGASFPLVGGGLALLAVGAGLVTAARRLRPTTTDLPA